MEGIIGYDRCFCEIGRDEDRKYQLDLATQTSVMVAFIKAVLGEEHCEPMPYWGRLKASEGIRGNTII